MAVVTADHQVGAPERFRQALAAAFEAAEAEPVLVTIGVRPTRPETGYGYIEVAAGAEPVHRSSAGVPVLAVTRFHEKPGRDAAEAYVASGRFLWNSGMFFWRVSTFLAELEQANPRLASGATALLAALRAGDTAGAEAVFQGFEDISIDYALMEHARRVLVVPADFPWDDVGAWDALERTLPRDAAGNVAVGDPLLLDSNGCVVYNAPGAERVAVAVIGAQELVVVVAEDAVLVVPKTRAQDVRRIVTALKARGAAQV
jgi:mannose-1-phosphate guanylyltransferase